MANFGCLQGGVMAQTGLILMVCITGGCGLWAEHADNIVRDRSIQPVLNMGVFIGEPFDGLFLCLVLLVKLVLLLA